MRSVSSFVHEVKFWYFFVISQYCISDSQSSNSLKNATDGYCGLRHSGYAAKNCDEHAVAYFLGLTAYTSAVREYKCC